MPFVCTSLVSRNANLEQKMHRVLPVLPRSLNNLVPVCYLSWSDLVQLPSLVLQETLDVPRLPDCHCLQNARCTQADACMQASGIIEQYLAANPKHVPDAAAGTGCVIS